MGDCKKRIEELKQAHAIEIAHLNSLHQHHRDAYISLQATIKAQAEKIQKLEDKIKLLDACRY